MKPAGGTSTRDVPMAAIRVTYPRAAGDVVVKACVAVDEDVDPRRILGRNVAGETIEMLLAVGVARKTL